VTLLGVPKLSRQRICFIPSFCEAPHVNGVADDKNKQQAAGYSGEPDQTGVETFRCGLHGTVSFFEANGSVRQALVRKGCVVKRQP
jgi:hypothetical protein